MKRVITTLFLGALFALNIAATKSAAQTRVPNTAVNVMKEEKVKQEVKQTTKVRRAHRHIGRMQGEP